MSTPLEEWAWRLLITTLLAGFGWMGRNYLKRIEKKQDDTNGSVAKITEKHEKCREELPRTYVTLTNFDKFSGHFGDKVDNLAQEIGAFKMTIIEKMLPWDGKERRQ